MQPVQRAMHEEMISELYVLQEKEAMRRNLSGCESKATHCRRGEDKQHRQLKSEKMFTIISADSWDEHKPVFMITASLKGKDESVFRASSAVVSAEARASDPAHMRDGLHVHMDFFSGWFLLEPIPKKCSTLYSQK